MEQSNNFFANLFGTIANGSSLALLSSSAGFIPSNNKGDVVMIKGETAVWLGMKVPMQQLYAYEYCYPLASVIDRLAEADIAGTIGIYYLKGKGGKGNPANSVFSNNLMRLLKRPNPMQTYEQFRAQQIVYKKIFGFCPVLPIVPAGFGPENAVMMLNLPPWLFTAIPAQYDLLQSAVDGMIKEYRVSLLGKVITLRPDQVMILDDGFTYSMQSYFLLPQSRLVGLDFAISNLCAAMEADNVLLRKKGPLGFISHDAAATKDSTAGYIPMGDDEKEELQDALSAYGMTWAQHQYVISRTAAKWNPMSFDVKALGTKETILESCRAVCQRYGFPYVLFQDSDATYSNQESAHKKLYDNNIIPNNKRDMSKYNDFFKCEENNVEVCADYDDLAVFQEDALNSGRARAYRDQGMQLEFQNNIITVNEWREANDLDLLPDAEGNKYYYETEAGKAGIQPPKPNPINENDQNQNQGK
jgi:hypothetical protein